MHAWRGCTSVAGRLLATLAVVAGGTLMPARPGADEPSSAAATVRAAGAGAGVPVAVSPTSDGRGFWVASTNGAVAAEGDAQGYGDASGLPLAAPVVALATSASGHGYWLLGSDGGVLSYGDARFHGSTGGMSLAQPALQMAATPSGGGYWFVARDGGVFSFGDAGFYGSTGNARLAQPIVGMTATPDGRGYWLVARDGGVFSFGDAGFLGSTGSVRLTRPIVGMARTGDGRGYWLVARDGGIFSFGDARFFGSTGGVALPAPVIGMVATGDGGGYWIVLGNGQVRAFGDASPIPDSTVQTVGFSLVGEVIGIDPGHNGANASQPGYIDQPVWNGRSYESCDTTGTQTDGGYSEAAFNFDVASRLQTILRSLGATVVLTRNNNAGVGPCVDRRATIINGARADVAIDIHADGGPPGGRGTTILTPVADGPNDEVVGTSDRVLAPVIRDQFEASTGEPLSDYDGVNGIQPRSDLAGLNLTTVPKVLIETANMRNGTDAALLEDPIWRQKAAEGLARGLSRYLIGFP